MRVYKGVFNSDRINRLDIQFSLGALESALSQRWLTGTPDNIGHDRHRLVGWSRPLGVHLQAGLARLTGLSFLPENGDELAQLSRRAGSYYADWVQTHVEPHVGELRAALGDAVSEEPLRCHADCAAIVSPGLAMRAFPEIFAGRDGDGLVRLSNLDAVAPGVFRRGALLLFAHPYFRRSLSRMNTLNSQFLGAFSSVDHHLNPRIALDEDMIGLATTLELSVELEYWWGPHFDDDLSRIPNGITTHRADDTAKLFHGISQTEFWWSREGAERSLEIEELVEHPSVAVASDCYGCRFVHSMLNEDEAQPVHLDGAIRRYSDETLLRRIDQTIYEAGRRAEYTKLWRVDGALEVPAWKELITQYFRDNWLVGEYFGAPPEPEMEPQVVAASADPISQVIPYNMTAEDGVQIHVSYFEKDEGKTSAREVVSFDCLTNGDTLYFMDSMAIEIAKRLRRQSLPIAIPDDLARIKFGDCVCNLPVFAHHGNGSGEAAELTLGTIAGFLRDLARSYDDRLASFTVAAAYDDREVRYSWAGHVNALVECFDRRGTGLPKRTGEVPGWIESNYEEMNTRYAAASNERLLHELLQETGMLVFRRSFLDPALYEIKRNDMTGELEISLLLAPEETALAEAMRGGIVQVAAAFEIVEAKCTLCGHDYEECPHCKFEEEKTGHRITQSNVLGAFWTNRKA